MKEHTDFHARRSYKDTLFRMIFREKDALLSLYNAVNGTCYTDSDTLEIVTLENAIYMNMKNDLAFVIDCSLNLYEHQSTYSPNMPIRNLFYITRELEKLVSKRTLYSAKQVLIPTPRFIVFYNGTDASWERKILKLSDAYRHKTDSPELELFVTMLNINLGKNDGILKNCRPLLEYMQYVDKVRCYSTVFDINHAVKRAVNESIKEGILADFLLQNKAEAIQMSIFEYDEEKEMKLIRQDERDIGYEKGITQGIQAFILDNLEEQVPLERIIEKLQKRFDLSKEDAITLMNQYNKN